MGIDSTVCPGCGLAVPQWVQLDARQKTMNKVPPRPWASCRSRTR